MDVSTKRLLIGYVREIAEETKLKNLVVEKGKGGKFSIDICDFQQISTLILHKKAEYYEEIKLLIESLISKGEGWDLQITGDSNCGEVILEYLEKIKNNTTEEKILETVGWFFGYLYRQSFILLRNKQRQNNFGE